MTTKLRPWIRRLGWALLLAAIFAAGVLLGGRNGGDSETARIAADGDLSEVESAPTIWTCAMHPQIVMPEPGLCPICGMELRPVVDSDDDTGEIVLTMSHAARKLAEIVTAPVERAFVDAQIRMVGKIDYDETRVKTIAARVPGRVDRLYVDYTGISVQRGDHLVDLYSPDLLTAQQELLEAKRRAGLSAQERSEFLRQSDQRALQTAREKLRLFGLSEAQIRQIEERESVEDHILIESPLSGVVIRKSVTEGQYVDTGSPIYTVADLSRVWVLLDAYELDLTWLHYGQHVDIETEAYPGQHFDGVISFIDPILDPMTRTVKIRVNVDNEDQRLKPGMFVRGTVHSRVAKGGKVMDPDLAGKWISPMHPEIVTEQAGDCPICGMDLVRAETLGYVSADDEAAKPLVIPKSAVLLTGKRAIAYVERPGMERPTYEGREVVLGPRAGNYYIVEQGLAEGEMVVVNGNFNIDSALQIRARPSMMSMRPDMGPAFGPFPELDTVYTAYVAAQDALADDDLTASREAFGALRAAVEGIVPNEWPREAQGIWRQAVTAMGLEGIDAAASMEELRTAFDRISTEVIRLERTFGHGGQVEYHEMYCPMAFGSGASWLQIGSDLRNPYYGERMLDCGEIRAVHPPAGAHDRFAVPVDPHAGHNH